MEGVQGRKIFCGIQDEDGKEEENGRMEDEEKRRTQVEEKRRTREEEWKPRNRRRKNEGKKKYRKSRSLVAQDREGHHGGPARLQNFSRGPLALLIFSKS
jgi:hypothetical protein